MQGSFISPSSSSAQEVRGAPRRGAAVHFSSCSASSTQAAPSFQSGQGSIFVQFPPSGGHAHYLPRVSDGMSVVHSSTHAGGAAPLSSPHSHTLSSSVGGGGGGKGEPPSVLQSQVHGERGGGKEGGERGTPAAAGCTHGGGGSGGGRGGEERGGTDGMVVGMGSSGDGALRLARGNAAGEGGEVVRVMAAAGVGESGGGGVVGGAGSRLGGGGMVAVEGGTEIHAAVVTPLKEKKGKKRKGSGGGEGEGAADEDGSDGSDDESDEAVTGQKKKKWTEAEIHHLVIVRCGMQVKFKNQGNNKENWKIVSSRMLENGFKRSSEQCRKKFERIWRKFQDLRAENVRRGGLEFKGHGAGFPHVYDLIINSPMVSVRLGERSHPSRSTDVYHSEIPETLPVAAALTPVHAQPVAFSVKGPRGPTFSSVGSPGAEPSAVASVLEENSFARQVLPPGGPVVGMPLVRPEAVDTRRHDAQVGSEGVGGGTDTAARDSLDVEPGRDLKRGKFVGVKSRQVLLKTMMGLLAEMDTKFWDSYDRRVCQQSECQRVRATTEAMDRQETNTMLRSLVNRLIKGGPSSGATADGA